ncbi:hypothetical protein FHS78_000649 [Parvibaculum indicum]|nr:hypothetical protein [Parvibaculum indicum]
MADLAPLGVSIGSKYAAGYRLDRFPGSGTHLPPVRQGEPPVGEGDGTAPSPLLSHANSLSTPREDCPGDRGPLGRANTSPDAALGADVDEASTGQSGRPAGEFRNAQGVSNRDVSTDGKPYAPDAPQGNPGPAQAIAEPVTVETMARGPAVHETQFTRTENTPAEAGDRPPPVEGRAASAPRGVRPCAPGACHRTGEPADE